MSVAPRIHLHIDRLVLRGVGRERQQDLVSTLRAELQARFAAPGFADALGRSRHQAGLPDTRPVTAPGSDAISLGRAFGGALAARLKR